MTKNTIYVDAVKASKTAQQRADGIIEATVDQYMVDAEASDSWPFPPIIVYHDVQDQLWVADGFHRLAAAQRLGIEQIPAEIRPGCERDATLHACGANSTHGLRRTNADKRKAVTTLLTDHEWSGWSDREIARRCQVHHDLVGTLRNALAESASAAEVDPSIRKTADGRTMDISGIGKANQKRANPRLTPTVDVNAQKQTAAKEGPRSEEQAQEVFLRIKSVCASLREIELPPQQWYQAAQTFRDTLIWVLPKIRDKDAALIRQKIADAAIVGADDE